MAFRVPTFNLVCNIFTGANFLNPPRVVVACQLAFGRRQEWVCNFQAGSANSLCPLLLVPALTDLRGFVKSGTLDGVEVPAGSGRKYVCRDVEDVAKGFSNEYRVGLLVSSPTWVVPYP